MSDELPLEPQFVRALSVLNELKLTPEEYQFAIGCFGDLSQVLQRRHTAAVKSGQSIRMCALPAALAAALAMMNDPIIFGREPTPKFVALDPRVPRPTDLPDIQR